MPDFTPLSHNGLHGLPAMVACGATDIGPVRKGNEDNFLIDESLGLAMVADGMGGHDAGEVASAAVLLAVSEALRDAAAVVPAPSQASASHDPDATWSDPAAPLVRLVQDAVIGANARLYAQNRAGERGDGGGMGTTLTGWWCPAGSTALVLFHIGDSRMYRLRGGALEQLSRDQTMYQQALEAGLFDSLPPRNLLLQAVGPGESIVPEVRSHPVVAGDVLMLCSDGLHGSVPHGDIENTLAAVNAAEDLPAAAMALIEMAKQYGGRDNITVLLALCSAPG